MNNPRANPRALAPNPLFREVGRQEFDVVVAQPKVNAHGLRSGERWSQEALDESYSGPFVQAAGDSASGTSHTSYDATLAPEGRTVLAGSNPPPTWDRAAVDNVMLANFVGGQVPGENMASTRGFMDHYPRRGANVRPLGPTAGFSVGAEVPGNVIQRKLAPPNGGRGRVNIADRTQF
jgi:hypothetical protein